MAFIVNASDFKRTTDQLIENGKRNAKIFADQVGQQFKEAARDEAPWTDRRGFARKGMTYAVGEIWGTVYVSVGYSAPNYKKGANSVSDYAEVLEFTKDGKYAVIYPVLESMEDDIYENFGSAVLGMPYVKLKRDREWNKKRQSRYRQRREQKLWERYKK